MAFQLDSDRYIRSAAAGPGSSGGQDWAGIAERAALPQSRKYRQSTDAAADFGVAPITPDAEATFSGTGSQLLYDQQFERAAADYEMAGATLGAAGEVQAAKIRRKAAEAAAARSKRSGVLGAVFNVAKAAIPFLCDARCKWDLAPWRGQPVEVHDELSELATAVLWIREHA